MYKHLAALAAAAVFLPCAAHAADPSYFDARLSTLGLGIEYGANLSPNLDARIVANGYNWDYKTTDSSGIHYTGKAKLGSVGAQLDYHFTEASPFYLSAGIYANGNKTLATANPTENTDIGNTPYTPEEIGMLHARAKYNGAAPYLGLGWRGNVGHVNLNAELGAYFQGRPTVDLTSDGTLADNTAYQAALAIERQNLQNDLKNTGTIPVIAFGVGYSF